MTVSELPAPAASAQLWLRHGHAVYLGPSLPLGAHSTAIACLAVGIDEPFVVSAAEISPITVRSFLFRARVTHEIVESSGRMLFCFFDPTSARMARCIAGMHRTLGPFGVDHRRETELIEVCSGTVDFERLLELASVPVIDIGDERIAAAAAAIRAEPGRKHPAADAARTAGLSTSHFLRLFSDQTATSFRRYILWARMLHVARAFSDGHDFTRAAADAGFSSPSHFSDTFRAMFGLTPTTLAQIQGALRLADSA
ncbi:helix-turn-helix transcriptional regulator [Nocardia sp. NPDC058058]|uniref:helix-turn-helix transcriptional regulator n=1 Tax=Nocardia sp. NPDC058058 TaxID=3346317 RepID=UPI0036DCC01A